MKASATVDLYLDFGKIARLIDGVTAYIPTELPTLLDVLWRSEERQTAKVVTLIAGQAEDPLAEVTQTCQDALRTAAQLDQLCAARHWRHPQKVVESPRCQGLLHLCAERIVNRHDDTARFRRYRDIRVRLFQAAEEERRKHQDEIERLETIRNAAVPDLLTVYCDFGLRVG